MTTDDSPDNLAVELRRLAAAGWLDDAALDRGLQLAAATRRRSWRAFTGGRLTFVGAVLLVAGAIFFVAANWQGLGPNARLALVTTALVGSTAVAAWRGRDSVTGQAAVVAAGLLCGALYALYGQIYQTGADRWTIYAAWSAVLAVFAWAGRSTLLWAASLLTLHLAAVLSWPQSFGRGFGDGEAWWLAIALAAFNAVLLVWLDLSDLPRPPAAMDQRAVPRLSALLGLGALTLMSQDALWSRVVPSPAWPPALLLVAVGALVLRYRRAPLDRMTLLLALVAAIVCSTSVLARLMDRTVGDTEAFYLVVGAAVIVQVGLAARWLLGLRDPNAEDPS